MVFGRNKGESGEGRKDLEIPKSRLDEGRVELNNFDSDQYGIAQQGAFRYIYDKETGGSVSDGFHDIYTFENVSPDGTKTVRGVVGRLGAREYPIAPPADDSPRFQTLTEGFHKIEYRFDLDSYTGKAGALTFLLDPHTGEVISGGYHTIVRVGDKLIGTTGGGSQQISEEILVSQRAESSSISALEDGATEPLPHAEIVDYAQRELPSGEDVQDKAETAVDQDAIPVISNDTVEGLLDQLARGEIDEKWGLALERLKKDIIDNNEGLKDFIEIIVGKYPKELHEPMFEVILSTLELIRRQKEIDRLNSDLQGDV